MKDQQLKVERMLNTMYSIALQLLPVTDSFDVQSADQSFHVIWSAEHAQFVFSWSPSTRQSNSKPTEQVTQPPTKPAEQIVKKTIKPTEQLFKKPTDQVLQKVTAKPLELLVKNLTGSGIQKPAVDRTVKPTQAPLLDLSDTDFEVNQKRSILPFSMDNTVYKLLVLQFSVK